MTDGTHEDEAVEKKTIYCSFCGKSEHDALVMVAGPDVFICDVCIEACRDIVGEHRIKKDKK